MTIGFCYNWHRVTTATSVACLSFWQLQHPRLDHLWLAFSSSQPGLFFGLAKIHKMQPNDKNVDNLPIRPVISNIGTATYQTSKYLAELLKPLAKSQYTMDSTDNFLERIKNIRIDNRYDMVSFDVVSLFTSKRSY